MNLNVIVEILNKTTRVVDPARIQSLPEGWQTVDLHAVVVAVDLAAAAAWHDHLVYQLRAWPNHLRGPDADMSYTDALELLQDPHTVFRLFALGEILELWKLTRPSTRLSPDPLRWVDVDQAARLADNGALAVSRFRPSLRNPPTSIEEARRIPLPPQ